MYEFCFLTRDRGVNFIARIEALGLVVTSRPDPINEDVTIVAIPDDIDDELLDRIEAWYEADIEENEAAARAEDAEDEFRSAGIWVPLSSGESSLARIDPALMNRLLAALTPDELTTFVTAIAQAVENPDQQPLCVRTTERQG
ncbi:hypothetical protein A9404_12615 [Halothiobacillus diazotrophicus]|uniref:Uncharacterized protein n=1 Tax=Halothiobacillus diazotrophicus TaxID=1860122 RepID=A0A191ZJQ5_9GAMM|nr:hypothetical protein [Halothiobacillus diazotrophicus]ANJ68100.1 hypothetical protein A9404_12615 [Halothiobacillus diazotrophicus]